MTGPIREAESGAGGGGASGVTDCAASGAPLGAESGPTQRAESRATMGAEAGRGDATSIPTTALISVNYRNPIDPSRRDWTSILTAAPAIVIIFICCGLPLLWMIGAAVFASPAVRAELVMTRFRAQLLARTLGYNGAAALIALAMGLPPAMVLGRGRGVVVKILWVILPAALLMPSLSYAYGWAQFVRIWRPELRPFGITFIPGGVADTFRCIWSLAAWLWAVPAGLVGLALRRMDSTVQQQALLDGALRRVTFRQLLPAMIASWAIVTVLATQEFAVYEPTGISVVATEVRMVFDTGALSSVTNSISGPIGQGSGAASPDQPARAAAAVATATPLLIATAILAVVVAWAANATSATEEVGSEQWPRALDASRWTSIAALALIVLNIGIPVSALIASLRINWTFHGVHLELYKMWEEFLPQVWGAVIVAAMAGAVALAAAFSAAGRWTRGLLILAGCAFLIGGQLLAIAVIRIYNRDWLEWAYDGCTVTVATYVGRFGWLALVASKGTWSRPWRDLRDMAAVDGASKWQMAFLVVWPIAWPMLAAGGLLVGALSMTEVPATVLLFPQNPQVLTPTLMTWVHMARFDPMIEASLLMMAMVLFPALLAVTLTSIGLGRARRGGA